jgi:hypothetical protein
VITKPSRVAGVTVLCGLLAVALTGTAQADTNVGNNTTFAAVGSDTTQDVVEALSSAVTDGGNPIISNYKATPVGRTITTRTTPPAGSDCTFTVPRSSGEGRNALSAAMRGASFAGGGGTATPDASANMTGCVDVARSSAFGNPTTSPGVGTMTFVPFATDALTYATRSSTTRPKALNFNTLKAIYTANGTPGSTACLSSAPLLPASGSGTRSFWATFLGITDSTIGTAGSWGTCVQDTKGGTPIQEHDGRVLTAANELVPFSVAQYIAQSTGVITDIRGTASLGGIDFTSAGNATTNSVSPFVLNAESSTANPGFKGPNGNATRTVYNVVPTDLIDNAFTPPAGASQIPIAFSQLARDTFVGPTSKICQATTVIQRLGFGLVDGCGATTTTNTN